MWGVVVQEGNTKSNKTRSVSITLPGRLPLIHLSIMDGGDSFYQTGEDGLTGGSPSERERMDAEAGQVPVDGEEGRWDRDRDFTSVTFDSSDDEPPTRDRSAQTIAPHQVNAATQYSDPDHFGTDTETDESTSSSRRPVLFSALGARRRRHRLRVSDWQMPNPSVSESSIRYTGNGHRPGQHDGPESTNIRPPQ